MPRGGRYGAPGGFGGGGTDDGDGGTDSDDSDSSRDRTVTSPSFDPGGFDGGGSTGGGDDDRDRDRDRDDDSGSSSSGSTGPSRQGRNDRTDGDAGAEVTVPAPDPDPEPPAADDPGPVFGDGSSGGGGGGGSPGGSSPPTSDVGGPAGPAPDDPTADMVADDPGPVFGDPAGGDSSSSDSDTGPQFGPGPGTDGGLGDPDPGGDGGEIVDDTVEAVESAEANDEIVDRATTGGLLSERGESAGLLPPESRASVPGRDDLVVDTSETRLRELASDSLEFGQSIDASGAFTSPADPLAFGGIAGPAASDPGPVDATGDAPPGTENPAEEFIEGAAALPFDAPGAALETETVAEAGQSLVDDDLVADFGAGEVGETAVAQGRDRAERTAGAIEENPAGFAGAVTAGAVVGAGGLSRGSTGTLGQAVRAELDPRIGPFGETLESQAFSRFLGDDRGQAQLVPESRDRGTDTDSGTGTDDLGPDLDPFDRSDSRLFDPNREFDDDLGGMADDGPTVDPSDASSRQDIGAGVGGRGEPGIVGSDSDSFSSRGFGDVSGTELDPNPTATLVDDLDTPGAATGGLLAAPESDLDALSGADGLLGAPDDLDSTGTTADLGDRTRTVTAPTFDADVFDDPTDAGPDTTTDVFSVSRTGPDLDSDTPTDTDPVDTPMFDNPTDTPTDPPTDTPTDPPSDVPTDPPTFDPPTDDPPERFPPGLGNAPDARSDGLRLETEGEVVENPTQTLEQADRFVVDTIRDNF